MGDMSIVKLKIYQISILASMLVNEKVKFCFKENVMPKGHLIPVDILME